MVGLTKEQRAERDQQRKQELDEVRQGDDGAFLQLNVQAQHDVDDRNDRDERAPDRRPATVVDVRDPNEVGMAEDNRQTPGDLGKALNQMVGRVAITERTKLEIEPLPAGTNPRAPVVQAAQTEGEEVLLLKGYQQNENEPKLQAGTVARLPARDVRRLVSLSPPAARYTDV